MRDWLSYKAQDFVPFTHDVYFRVIERTGESLWPLQLITLALGALTLGLALNRHPRLACTCLCPAWASVAHAFFSEQYSQVYWAASHIGMLFFLQAFLLLTMVLSSDKIFPSLRRLGEAGSIGLLMVLAGLLGYPALAIATGADWQQAEFFGTHPDPTALTTLGLLFLISRSWLHWLLALIPLAWLLLSGITLFTLGDQRALLQMLLILAGLLSFAWAHYRGG